MKLKVKKLKKIEGLDVDIEVEHHIDPNTDKVKYVYCKREDGYSWWEELDENGNEIYSKDSDGIEKWRKYDKNNNLIYTKNSEGYEEEYEYDQFNNEVSYKNSEGKKRSKKTVQSKEKQPFTFE
jgi:YD repeat-containing protein